MSEATGRTGTWVERTLEDAGARVWRLTLPSGRLEWTRRGGALGPATEGSDLESWLGLVHHEDQAILRSALERAIQQSADLDVEYRMRAAPGRWVRSIARRNDRRRGELTGISVGVSRRGRAEDALIEIARDLRGTGRSLLDSITAKLGSLLGADVAYVGQVGSKDPDTVHMLSLWAGGMHQEPVDYPLKGTPCEAVVGQELCVHRAGIQEMFPEDELLREKNVEAYAGVPLWDDEGRPIGLLCVLWREPLERLLHVRPVLRILADISARELWRSRLEAERRMRTDALSRFTAALAELSRSQAWTSGDRLDAFRAVSEVGAKTLGVSRVSVWLYDEERTSLILQDMYHRDTGRHDAEAVIERGSAPSYFAALDADRAIAAEHVLDDPRMKELSDYLQANGITSMLDAPVRVEGHMAGVVCCEHRGPPHRWTEEEITFVGSLGDFASLAEMLASRRKLEAQLRHSQRLESVGRLAGGVAHDFNNLLTVIQASVEMLRLRGSLEGEDADRLGDVADAADRAAQLTRQLLAFARSSPIEFRRVDLNEVVRGAERMLRRLITAGVELDTHLGEVPGWVWADASQLEQVLINLAVNARDAMPRGGRLALATKRQHFDTETARGLGVPEGAYVVLSVSDTGEGMEPEVLAHVFEPFFTTKAPGRGTGLGLATSYGIIRQSNGFVFVDSTPGEGTTFRILLPALAAAAMPDETDGSGRQLPQGNELVLLVEDDAAVRQLTAAGLGELGYRVLVAEGRDRALELAREHRDAIAIIVTDVVMPKASGPEVAAELRQVLPRTPLLFVSGYPRGALERQGLDTEDVELMLKPFTPTELGARMRSLLDRQATRAPSGQG